MIEPTDRDAWVRRAINAYAAMLDAGIHFAQAGYRDGEFAAILGHSGKNINGEVYTAELGAALEFTLMNPVGQLCCFWWPHPTIGARVHSEAVEWLKWRKPPVQWLPERPVFEAVKRGFAAPFFAACRKRRIMVIGPLHLQQLPFLDFEQVVPAPKAVAWQHADELSEIAVDRARPGDIILVAAGMGGNLIVHRIYRQRKDLTVLDIGSSLDPFCGVFSRGPFRDEKWQREIMPRNVPC